MAAKFKIGDRVRVPVGVVSVIVDERAPLGGCAGCPRREHFVQEPERYQLCTGCTPEGDEGVGFGHDRTLLLRYIPEPHTGAEIIETWVSPRILKPA